MTSIPDESRTAPVPHHAPEDVPVADGQLSLPPLTVSALMVTKADLIAALRVYLPHLSDVEMIDGERFLLSVAPLPSQDGAS